MLQLLADLVRGKKKWGYRIELVDGKGRRRAFGVAGAFLDVRAQIEQGIKDHAIPENLLIHVRRVYGRGIRAHSRKVVSSGSERHSNLSVREVLKVVQHERDKVSLSKLPRPRAKHNKLIKGLFHLRHRR